MSSSLFYSMHFASSWENVYNQLNRMIFSASIFNLSGKYIWAFSAFNILCQKWFGKQVNLFTPVIKSTIELVPKSASSWWNSNEKGVTWILAVKFKIYETYLDYNCARTTANTKLQFCSGNGIISWLDLQISGTLCGCFLQLNAHDKWKYLTPRSFKSKLRENNRRTSNDIWIEVTLVMSNW